jgi:hypothetical protein
MKLRIHAMLLISLLLIFTSTPVSAQTRTQKAQSDWGHVRQISFDAELIIETRNGNIIRGWMKKSDDTTVSVSNYRRVTEVPRLSIRRISVKGSVSLPKAAAVGLAAGSRVGYEAGRTGSLKGAAIGAGIGAILGAIFGSGKPKTTLVYEAGSPDLRAWPTFFLCRP